jgi:2-methylcitrate dehydratase
MDKYEKQISEYVVNLKYGHLTKEVIQTAKERLLDSFAVAFAAYDAPPVRAMRNFALQYRVKNGATVFGTPYKAPVDYAAVCLGTMIRALDWNDTYLNREPGHPSDNIAACLPVAEAEGKSGKDLILAIVLAYELQCRLCDAAGIRKKGWDHVTYGSISSSAAVAKLMNFSAKKVRDALAIAMTTGNYLRQTRIGEISEWKAAAFAHAGQNALRAVQYVRQGLDGPGEIFTGKHGLINQITLGEFDLAGRFGGQDGEPFKILSTYIKYFPAEYHSQSAIWAALALREIIGKAHVRDIAKIHVETSFHSYDIIGREPAKWAPKSRETADHSLPYIVSAAMMDGDITLRQFDSVHLKSKELLALIQKVTVAEKKEYTDVYGKSFPNKIAIIMNDGTVHEREVLDPKGHPNNPLTPDEVDAKFRSASANVLTKRRQDDFIKKIWDLDKMKDVGELMKLAKVE